MGECAIGSRETQESCSYIVGVLPQCNIETGTTAMTAAGSAINFASENVASVADIFVSSASLLSAPLPLALIVGVAEWSDVFLKEF